MFHIKHRTFLYFVLLFSTFAIFSAYFIQYVLKHEPCNLCLIQRVPYFISIIIISLCLLFKRFEKFSLITLSIIFFSATLIASYHFAIEQGFITESLVCSLSDQSNSLSKETLLNLLQEVPVSCKNVTFTIFGLSLATFNIFISFIFAVITTKLFLNYEKNR